MYTKPVDVSQPHTFGKPKAKSGIDYSPLKWDAFFDRVLKIDDKVPVYIAGNQGHVFLCLHGAGYSA